MSEVDAVDTPQSLRDSIDRATSSLEDIARLLEVLRKRTVWNRALMIALGFMFVAVTALGIAVYREARQADDNFRHALLVSCERDNRQSERILTEEQNLINAMARISNADPVRLQQFLDLLESGRGDTLKPVNCGEAIN